MNIYDSDNLDRESYDDLGQKHSHESLSWTDNIFGESIPGEDDTDDTAGDDMASSDVTADTEEEAEDDTEEDDTATAM